MMDPEEVRKWIKRIAFIAVFFVVALLFYIFGASSGNAVWRKLLVVYGICVGIVAVLAILLQSGRGGGLASLGGLGGDSLLGTRSATPIAKATYVMLALFLFIFMLTQRLSQRLPEGEPPLIGAPERPPAEAPARPSETPGAPETGRAGAPSTPEAPPAGTAPDAAPAAPHTPEEEH
jgi:protein translocase SecG subunit